MKKFYRFFDFIYYKNFYLNYLKCKDNYRNFKKNFKYENIYNNSIFISKDIFKVARKSFKKLIKSAPESYEITNYFLNCDLEYLYKKINIEEIRDYSPILICVEKNDLLKIKMLIEHHKQIGVKYFVFIDNGSDDGTLEYLKKFDNVDVIISKTKYYTLAREAWINRILFHYGFNKWYLVVDSDELYNYIGSEKKDISEHIIELNNHHVKRELSFMLDMYSKEGIFNKVEDIKKQYRFFDCNTYQMQYSKYFTRIIGGPRMRTFKENNENKEFMLGKYPLSYFEKGDLQSNSHFTFPFYKNITRVCSSVLMHYKFVGDDIKKYEQIIKDGNYSNGSSDYKAYLEQYKNNKVNFYYENSCEYIDSNSLKRINILKETE